MNTSHQGHLIVVVGPSGAGKDSLLNAARKQFQDDSRVGFVKRVITRECDPSSEVHDSLSTSEFIEQEGMGAFSVHWQANGLYYGLPSSVFDELAQGHILIANGSRAALPAIRDAFTTLTIVHVTANASVLADRLALRSRESREEIAQRLERNNTMAAIEGDDVLTIDNSGARETAIEEFLSFLSKQLV